MYGPRFRCSSEFRDARVRRALPLSLASPVFLVPPNGYGIGGGVLVSVPVCMSTVYNRSKPTTVNASESRMLESGVQAAGIALITTAVQRGRRNGGFHENALRYCHCDLSRVAGRTGPATDHDRVGPNRIRAVSDQVFNRGRYHSVECRPAGARVAMAPQGAGASGSDAAREFSSDAAHDRQRAVFENAVQPRGRSECGNRRRTMDVRPEG